jgi:hypothetical protein
VSHIIKIAAMSALRPVRGTVGSKFAVAAPAEAVEDEPPPVADGFDWGLALPVMQVFTPLITPLECAVSNWSQIFVLVLVV